MRVLTMTRILSDVDTVAMMGYNEAANRSEFVREFCRENYGAANPELTGAVNRVLRDTTKIFTGSTGDRKAIGTEALY